MSRNAFAATYDVSRETLDKLDRYAALLTDWQTRMNLVGASTIPDVWTRHFADSAQLATMGKPATDRTTWLDIGSGAGFPALILALLCPGRFVLVEATTKKCQFLQEVADEIEVADRVSIRNARIETLPVVAADRITARACAPLDRLFDWGARHGRAATWLLLKGQTAEAEVAAARLAFDFAAELIPSRTDPRARIVVARDVRRSRR